MTHSKPLDPADRIGIYKRLSDVPDRYRLHQHAAAYEGRDVWTEFCEEYEYDQGDAEDHEQVVDRVGRRWKAHMEGRGRHHALATPEDVEAWCAHLLGEREYSPRYSLSHLLRVIRLYSWLQWHTKHPHVYHPPMMAAAAGGAAGRIWEVRVERILKRRERGRSEASSGGGA